MVTAKQNLDISLVLKFLQQEFDKDSSNVSPISDGLTSAAFFFNVGKVEYVVRIGGNLGFFEKDQFAAVHFASGIIPIPKIIKMGEFSKDTFYTVSKRVYGDLLYSLNEENFKKILPSFINVLDEIHKTDISKYSGFGDWDKKGKAFHSSWKACLESMNDESYFRWQNVFTETFFKKETFDLLYKKLLSLLIYCPEDRYLVHGDFGFNNAIAKDQELTAVLDWGLSKYGDFLYDVAWIDFWQAQVPLGKIFFEHYKEKGWNTNHFKERLICYKLHFVIGTLHFAATSSDKSMYDYVLDKALSQLSDI